MIEVSSKIGVVLLKEYWTYTENKSTLYSFLLPPLVLIITLIITILTNDVVLTPQTRALALNQITSSPGLFGIDSRDLKLLGDSTITVAILVVQIPIVIQIFTFIVTYNAVVQSFAFEKINKTMEVLFSTPLSEEDIVYGKMIACVTIGLLSIVICTLTNSLCIQYIFLSHTGKFWSLTFGYLTLSLLLPLSMLFLALPIGLFVSVRAKSGDATKWGSLAGLFPIILFIIGWRYSPAMFFAIVELLGSVGFVMSMTLALISRKIINRLAFIVN